MDNNYHCLVIDYSAMGAQFYVDEILLHAIICGLGPLTNSLVFPCTVENINSNGYGANILFTIRMMSISSYAKMLTLPVYKHISTSTTTICKYGPGMLHKIVLNNPTNNFITVYDNTAASGNIIAIIDPDASATPIGLEYKCPFFTGLTIVTEGTPDLTVIYE